ncbi:hypothetical protein, partial [Actinophytocola sp.]|uniref:hypothetical protein n=1 Tax=Actinophytocola sp. TaxID=1872138 RepID=UPI00389A157A
MTAPDPPDDRAPDTWAGDDRDSDSDDWARDDGDDWEGADQDAEDPDAGDPDPDEPVGQAGGIGTVGGHHNVSVTDASGPVHIGDRVRLYLQSVAAEAGTARPPRLVPEDILTDLDRRFVMPPGYGDLVARLRNPGTVVVAGAPGCGRRSAALMVLKDSGEGATRFRELPDDDADGRFVLDAACVEPGERLLLDLSTVTISREMLGNLRAYRAAVAERQAYLAVVLSARVEYVAAEIGVETTLVARPDGRAVFRRHLSALGIEASEEQLADGALTALV